METHIRSNHGTEHVRLKARFLECGGARSAPNGLEETGGEIGMEQEAMEGYFRTKRGHVAQLEELESHAVLVFVWATDRGQRVDIMADAPSVIRPLRAGSISRMVWKKWAVGPSAKQSGFKRSPLGYMT